MTNDSTPRIPGHPLAAIHAQLCAPFADSEIEWKPAKGGGPKLPYVKAPAIMDRLDQVVGPGGWYVHTMVADNETGAVTVILTVLGISMSDFGDSNNPKASVGAQAFKEAASDGLKRAARLFGIGRYLWQLKPGQALPAAPHAETTQSYAPRPQPAAPHHPAGDARVMQRPAGPPAQQPQQQGGNRPVLPATEAQIKAIYAIARGKGMDDADLDERCDQLYNVFPPSALSRQQASAFIDALKAGG